MRFTIFHNTPIWYKIVIIVFIFFGCVVFFTTIGAFMASLVFDMSFQEVNKVLEINPSRNIEIHKFFQGVQSIGLFIFPSLLIAWLISPQGIKFLNLHISPQFRNIVLVVIAAFFAGSIINFLEMANSKINIPEWFGSVKEWMVERQKLNVEIKNAFLKTNSTGDFMINILLIAILPGIGEELLFRGILQPVFTKLTKNVHWGIIITAILFSLIHFEFKAFLPILFLGCYLGYLYLWSSSIWLPTIAHIINNAIVVFIFYLSDKPLQYGEDSEVLANSDNIIIQVVFSIIFFLIVYAIYIVEKSKRYSK